MIYLANFGYKEPDERYWLKLNEDSKRRSRIRKKLLKTNPFYAKQKTDLTPFRKSPNYEDIKDAFYNLKNAKTKSEAEILANKADTLLATPYNQSRFSIKRNPYVTNVGNKAQKFNETLAKSIYGGREGDKINNLMRKKMEENPYEVAPQKPNISNTQQKATTSNPKPKVPSKLGRNLMYGLGGTALLGAGIYGFNRLRKSRSDKGKKRGFN